MKFEQKIIALSLLLLVSLGVAAQGTERDRPTDKDGLQILPEKGDLAIGIQANRFLQYAGNIFGKTNTNGSPIFQSINNSFYVKKFMDQNTAVRATLQLSKTGNTRIYADVNDDQAQTNPLNTAQVEEAVQSANYANSIGLELEKRRGYGRLQGFYGGGLSANFGGNTSKMTYGNAMSNSNPRPTSYNSSSPTIRVLESTDSYFGVGANGFIGVEYFVARKISLQGEIGWTISYNWQNDASALYETVLNGERTEYTRNAGNDEIRTFNYFNVPSSNIGVFFHF